MELVVVSSNAERDMTSRLTAMARTTVRISNDKVISEVVRYFESYPNFSGSITPGHIPSESLR